MAVAAPPPAIVHVVGRSVEGRRIVALERGDPAAPRKVLVVGAIHGNETAGIAVVRRLERLPVPAGVDLWLVATVNPDGVAAGTRGNAHGVDLNRNFPRGWRPLDGIYESGPRAASEPETRAVERLVRRLKPQLTIWFHQHLALVELVRGSDARLVRRLAHLVRLPARTLPRYPGTVAAWENATVPGSSALVVELPAGPLAKPDRCARAVLAVGSDPATEASRK
jgi:protein MpaA